jgi:hypothetical protein
MDREGFRRELNEAFDRMSGAPSSDLSARVRSAIVEAPEHRGPVWIAALAAALIAVMVVGLLFVVGPLGRQHSLVPGVTSTPSPSATSGASPNPSPNPSPTPSTTPTSNLPAFICTSSSPVTSKNAPVPVYVDAVRVGTHTGYDRITIELKNGLPGEIDLTQQGNATFTQGASGQTVVLQGDKGLLLTLRGADEHTDYTGSADFKTGYKGLREARQVQDFEGVVQWGLGLSGTGCYRMFFLTSPARIVIDIQTS